MLTKEGKEKYDKMLLHLKGMKSIFAAVIIFSFYIRYTIENSSDIVISPIESDITKIQGIKDE
ncbi:hypothetical protein ACWGOQ_0010830 [Aquimarina sp. M1]